MHTFTFDDDELRLVQVAVSSYLNDFGHDEADMLRRLKALKAKLAAEESEAPLLSR